ncbi:penicillin acylase family protein [Streptomyces sp. NPDC017254]|uniref:penicillin acylase family protein n=1 Tax=unclassified Streptomyces TaxID=2593676 RepID=UPI00379AF114
MFGTRPFRSRLGRPALTAAVLAVLTATLPGAAAADPGGRVSHPSDRGLSAVVRYTEYGIPHIVGKDYASLGFGTGWAQAADQICTLADGFLTVNGERSWYFGPDAATDGSLSSAATNLSSDLYFRGVKEAGTVEALLGTPAPAGPSHDLRELMRGWAAGYNTWLRGNRITDPACARADWVRPVTAVDVARRGYAVSVLGGQGRAVDGITASRPPAAPPAPLTGVPGRAPDPERAAEAARALFAAENATMGSNAVAFSGATTANGRGLLLGNPHYPWQGGRRFWQSQQTIPGELNVSGASLLGTTVVNIGFNDRVAWSHTVATGVPLNLHQLTLAPGDPTSYLVDGRPERMTPRRVTVPVKGGPPVTRTQWWTRYGPVVGALGAQLPLPWTTATAYALNDPNAANLRASDTALGFARSRSVQDMADTLRRTQGLPWVNTIAADSAGHSLFTQAQVLPRITDELAARCSTPLGRATYPSSGVAVLDGSRADCALGSDPDAVQPGVFGPARMPVLRDTPYVENSNDSAWLTNADRPLTGYERIFGTVATPRSLRTRGGVEDVAAMAERGDLTVADLQRQQFADRAPAGALAAADAARACATALPGDPETCRVIGAWDRTVNSDSRGALLFDRFWRKFTASTPPAQQWTVPFSPTDPVRTPNTLNTAAPGFAKALADAAAELRTAGIPLDAPLGGHQFVVRKGDRIAVSGGTESLGVWNKTEPVWNAAGGGYTEVTAGSSHVQAVGWDGSRCPVARTLLTYSQSSNPASPHYSDQTRLYAGERWVTSRFCEKDILRSPALRVVIVRG